MPIDIDGFRPAVSLRQLLLKYFASKVVIEEPSEKRDGLDSTEEGHLFRSILVTARPPATAFFVYVAELAPPSPTMLTLTNHALRPSGVSLRHGSWLPDCNLLSRNYIRSKPFLTQVIEQLHPLDAQWLISHCAVVCQRHPGEGCQHVLGVSVVANLPRERKVYRRPLASFTGAKRARSTSTSTCQPTKHFRAEGCRAPTPKEAQRSEALRLAFNEPVPTNGLLVAGRWKGECPTSDRIRNIIALPKNIHCADDYLVKRVKLVRDAGLATDPTGVWPACSRLCESSGFSTDTAHIVDCFMGQLAGCDLRNHALRLTHQIEDKFFGPSAGPSDANTAEVPPSTVTAFVMSIIGNIKYAPMPLAHQGEGSILPPSAHTPAQSIPPKGHLLKPPHSRPTVYACFWGGQHNTTSIGNSILRWLEGGVTREASLRGSGCHIAAHFLNGVEVGVIPWLQSVRVCQHTRRGQIQQLMFAEIMIFVLRQVIPVLVEKTFYFTHSPRNRSSFVIYPMRVWLHLRAKAIFSQYGLRVQAQKEPDQATAQPLPLFIGLKTIKPLDIWRKAQRLKSLLPNYGPHTRTCIYSSVRLLPDGRKLRPIATLRVATPSTLVYSFKGGRRKADRARRDRAHPVVRPNAGILKQARQALAVGHRIRCEALGLPPFISNRSHQEEYSEWLGLHSRCVASGDSIYFVRGDAQKCYDSLPQAAVLQCISDTIPHKLYYSIPMGAVVPQPVGGAKVAVRDWTVIVPSTDFEEGLLRGIPAGWVVEERGAGQGCFPKVNASQDITALVPRHTSSKPHSYDALDGCVLRRVLEVHTQQHLIAIDVGPTPKIYKQSIGLAQGSAVSMPLCDALYLSVDQSLCEQLTQYPEGQHMLLRRVDDVMVATSSLVCAKEVHTQMLLGWPSIGFRCSQEKVKTTANAECHQVPWCGLIVECASELHCGHKLAFSVDWSRFFESQPRPPTLSPPGANDTIMSALRSANMLRMRTPITVFCDILNPFERRLQTCCEVALAFCGHLWAKVIANMAFTRPHVRMLLKPFALAKRFIVSHVRNQQLQLQIVRKRLAVVSIDNQRLLTERDVSWALANALAYRYRLHSPLATARPMMAQLGAISARKVKEASSFHDQNDAQMFSKCFDQATSVIAKYTR